MKREYQESVKYWDSIDWDKKVVRYPCLLTCEVIL